MNKRYRRLIKGSNEHISINVENKFGCGYTPYRYVFYGNPYTGDSMNWAYVDDFVTKESYCTCNTAKIESLVIIRKK